MISCYHNMLMDYILPSSTLSSMYCHFWLQQTLMAMILKNSMSDVTVALHFGGSRWVFFFNPVILFTVWLQFIIEGTMLFNVSMDFGKTLHPTQLNLNQISGYRQETTSWLEKPHLPHDTSTPPPSSLHQFTISALTDLLSPLPPPCRHPTLYINSAFGLFSISRTSQKHLQ